MAEVSGSAATSVPLEERIAAFLAFKFGKRPSDSLLEYCIQWGQTRGTRYEAARLLAKRRRQHGRAPEVGHCLRGSRMQ